MPVLTCNKVPFYSEADESAFFYHVKNIKAVQRIECVGDSIWLHVSSRLSQQSLRDLIALFRRYRISNMSQLAFFVTDSNRIWFTDPQQFWHRKVFRNAPAAHHSK